MLLSLRPLSHRRQHGRRSSKWFGGAANFCPKNDLMHCVSLSKLRRFFLPKLRSSPKTKKKVFTETETVFWQWCAQISRLFAQINRPFARIFDVLNRMGGDRPPCPPASYDYGGQYVCIGLNEAFHPVSLSRWCRPATNFSRRCTTTGGRLMGRATERGGRGGTMTPRFKIFFFWWWHQNPEATEAFSPFVLEYTKPEMLNVWANSGSTFGSRRPCSWATF